VGDFVRCQSRTGIFRIESLSYKQKVLDVDDENVQPHLILSCSRWSLVRGRRSYRQSPGLHVQLSPDDVLAPETAIIADVRQPLFCHHLVIDGLFIWIEIFVDSFGMGTSKGGAASTGIYAAISNTRRDVRHVQSFVHTCFVLPQGVDPMSVMWRISQDLIELQNGYQVFDSATQSWHLVKGAVSQLPSDHAQALKTTRALGNNANVTGRCCWVPKSERVKAARLRPDGVSCLDHSYTRREAQTDVCVEQMRATLGPSPNSALIKRIQARYGVRVADRAFLPAVEVDTHMQSFWDSSHLFWHNITPRLLSKFYAMASKTGKGARSCGIIFRSRMNLFQWRRGLGGHGSTPWKPGLGRSVSLSQWKTFLLIAIFASEGVGSQPWQTLILNFWKLSCLALKSTGLSCAELSIAQNLCLTCIRGFLDLGGRKKNSEATFFDLPCLHGLWELCFRTLPALRNGNFAKVDSFETHHRVAKIQGAGARHEEFSLFNMVLQDGLVRMLHGMRWGDLQQFGLGPGWTPALQRHPIFVELTPFSGKLSCDQEIGWSATKSISGTLDEVHAQEVLRAVELIDDHVNAKDVKLRLIAGFRRFHKSSTETVCPGDSVSVLFDNTPAWAALEKPFVEATWGKDEVRLFAFPTWYEIVGTKNGAPQAHRTRNTVLLKRFRLQNTAYPIEAHAIIERVHVVHSCKRTCSSEGHVNCRCQPNCYVKFVCATHEQEEREDQTCAKEQFVARDYHNPQRDLYEVLTSLHGLQFEKRRGQYLS
jgi:hypothetical protein